VLGRKPRRRRAKVRKERFYNLHGIIIMWFGSPRRSEMTQRSKGGGKRTENPPPRTSRPVRHTAGEKLKGGNKAERQLAGSVERHIEPRKPPKK
jgi:hypothetical protein